MRYDIFDQTFNHLLMRRRGILQTLNLSPLMARIDAHHLL